MKRADENLSQIAEILQYNKKAWSLACQLWEFFDARIICSVREDDGAPNEFRLEGIEDPDQINDVSFVITLRRNDRLEAGLVHELLHANLIASGYPSFFLSEQEEFKWNRGRDILNLASHEVMEPTFVSLGYTRERFVGPSKPLDESGRRVVADLGRMDLTTPQNYATHLSNYLRAWGVEFESIIWLGDLLQARRDRR